MEKYCPKCDKIKNVEQFHKCKRYKNGYQSYCKECRKKYFFDPMRLKKSFYDKDRYLKNKDSIKTKAKIYESKMYKESIEYRLKRILRARLRSALKNDQKSGSAVKDLGCTIEEFKNYIQSKFQKGMTWQNYGYEGWYIDHIIPLSKFNLIDREQFLLACHYTNLQPLWKKDNLSKKR